MKKRTLFLSAVLTILLIAGCTGEKNQDPPYSTDSFGNLVLSAEMEKTIKLAYLDAYAGRHISTDSIDMAFYGEFNGAYAVYVMGLDSTATLGSETVEGITFWYPTFSETMCIYYEGKCCRLQEAFDRSLLTLEDLKTLENNYPFNDQFDPTEPTTTPPETTAPTETTVPPTTAVVNSYCDLPQITVAETLTTLPNKPALTDLVTTGYEGGAQWVDLCSNVETVTIQLPAITPFSKDAIAINKEIQDTFTPILEKNRDFFDQKLSGFELSVSYEAWLNGKVLSILITTDTHLDAHSYYTYSLDISSGQRLSEVDLVLRYTGKSYPEFLYHATYTVYSHFSKLHTNQGTLHQGTLESLYNLERNPITMLNYQLYVGENNTLMLCSGSVGDFKTPVNIPYDPCAYWEKHEDYEDMAYDLLVHMQTSGVYAEAWAALLAGSFFCDPEGFVKHLSGEEDALIKTIAESVACNLHTGEIEPYARACEAIRDGDDPLLAKTAQKLLNGLAVLADL